jgi:multiple sugar transport system permease protein
MTDTTTGTAEISVRADAGLAAASGRGLRAPGERNPAAYWFLAPALLLIFTFFFLPVVAALALSFTDFDIYAVGDIANTRWVGLRNYVQLLTLPLFWQALRNTFYFALVGGPLSIGVSLGAALLLNNKLVRFKGLFRTIYFAPFVTTLVAVAIVWRYLYHTRYGLLNYGLGALGMEPVDWLGDPRWAMPAIILMTVWKSFGYNMLIFIAGLQAIPGLAPTLVFVTVITMIGFFQLFVEPYVMTMGGPLRSTTSVVLLMYEEGFRWWRMGHAAAVAFILFVVILLATLLQLALQKRAEAA